MEVPGAVVRMPRIRSSSGRSRTITQREIQVTARTSDIQAALNFIRSEVTINFFLSEAGSNEVAEKLNRQDWIGAAESLRLALKSKLAKALLKNIKSKVKIIHEAVPELYLRHIPETEDFLGSFKKMAMEKLVEKLVEKLMGKAFESVKTFFKSRSKEFSEALAQPDDGITLKIFWTNVAGMAQIRSIIKLLRGDGSLGDISSISMPAISAPVIIILAGKKFI